VRHDSPPAITSMHLIGPTSGPPQGKLPAMQRRFCGCDGKATLPLNCRLRFTELANSFAITASIGVCEFVAWWVIYHDCRCYSLAYRFHTLAYRDFHRDEGAWCVVGKHVIATHAGACGTQMRHRCPSHCHVALIANAGASAQRWYRRST